MTVAMLKIKKLENLCTSCPSQWEGETISGERVYIRYRWGYLTLDVDGKEAYSIRCGADYDGTMDTDEMKRLLRKVIRV